MDTCYKKFPVQVLRKRLNRYAESVLKKYQPGFRRNRVVRAQLFVLK